MFLFKRFENSVGCLIAFLLFCLSVPAAYAGGIGVGVGEGINNEHRYWLKQQTECEFHLAVEEAKRAEQDPEDILATMIAFDLGLQVSIEDDRVNPCTTFENRAKEASAFLIGGSSTGCKCASEGRRDIAGSNDEIFGGPQEKVDPLGQSDARAFNSFGR